MVWKPAWLKVPGFLRREQGAVVERRDDNLEVRGEGENQLLLVKDDKSKVVYLIKIGLPKEVLAPVFKFAGRNVKNPCIGRIGRDDNFSLTTLDRDPVGLVARLDCLTTPIDGALGVFRSGYYQVQDGNGFPKDMNPCEYLDSLHI